MKKEVKSEAPKWAKSILVTTFIFYIWYFISTLLFPIAEFLNLPQKTYLTIYKIMSFPPAILGFMICVSLISTVIVILEFKENSGKTKMFLTESITFMLYFIIPIVATILLLVLLAVKITGQIPSQARISYFLEDLFLFTSALFLMTAVLNVATQKIIAINTKKR